MSLQDAALAEVNAQEAITDESEQFIDAQNAAESSVVGASSDIFDSNDLFGRNDLFGSRFGNNLFGRRR